MDCGWITTSICFGSTAKEPARFDHFEPFVHQSRRIDGDALPHAPVGMRQRLFRSGLRHLRNRSLAKRAARSRQDQPPHFARAPRAQALVDGVVLAIHGQQFHALGLGRSHHQFARRHQDFLVRQSHPLPCLNRRIGRFQAHHAHRCRNHRIRIRMRRHAQQAFPAVHDLGKSPAVCRWRQSLPQLRRFCRVGHGDQLRPVPRDLSGKLLEIRTRRQRRHATLFRHRLHHLKSLAADRAGRTEYGQCFHKRKFAPGLSRLEPRGQQEMKIVPDHRRGQN